MDIDDELSHWPYELKRWHFNEDTHPYTALREFFVGKNHEQIEKIIEDIDKGNVLAEGNGISLKINDRLDYIDLISIDKGNTLVHVVQLWGKCKRRKAHRYGYAGRITTKK